MFGLFYFSLHLVFGHGLHIFAFIFHYIYRCFSFICYVLCYLVLRYLYLFVLLYLQFPSYFIYLNLLLPGDQEGLFKLAIQLRKFLFITL
jgi:hypothetical protein